MDYTLTRIDLDNPQQPYPPRKEIVRDPLEDQVHKNIYMGKLEDMLHGAVNWGRKKMTAQLCLPLRPVRLILRILIMCETSRRVKWS